LPNTKTEKNLKPSIKLLKFISSVIANGNKPKLPKSSYFVAKLNADNQ